MPPTTTLPESLDSTLSRIVETQLKVLRSKTIQMLHDASTDDGEFYNITTYGIPFVEWWKECEKEYPEKVNSHLTGLKDVERANLLNKSLKCLKGEGLVEFNNTRCILTWDGECILDSLEQLGGIKAMAEAIEMKPGIFGFSVDLKKLISAALKTSNNPK